MQLLLLQPQARAIASAASAVLSRRCPPDRRTLPRAGTSGASRNHGSARDVVIDPHADHPAPADRVQYRAAACGAQAGGPVAKQIDSTARIRLLPASSWAIAKACGGYIGRRFGEPGKAIRTMLVGPMKCTPLIGPRTRLPQFPRRSAGRLRLAPGSDDRPCRRFEASLLENYPWRLDGSDRGDFSETD